MTDYVFVLGKNWILSLAELLVVLDNLGLKFSLKDHSRNTAIVSIQDKLSQGDIVDLQEVLGGCFKIGKMVATYKREIVEGAFPFKGGIRKADREFLQQCSWIKSVWRDPTGRRIKFAVSTYPMVEEVTTIDLKRFTLGMDQWIKEKLLAGGARKAAYHAYSEPDKRNPTRPNTALWPQAIARHGLLKPPNSEILAALAEKTLYLARTIVVYDSMLQQYRDESRPYISSEISTSPKICRTLLNMAGAKRGDTVLDPFCGTGTVLMEAAILGMNCIGIDVEGNAVQGARSNLKWLGKDLDQFIDFKIIKGDARHASELIDGQVDAVAFEPHLGPVHLKRPVKKDVQATIKELTGLYRDVLTGLVDVLRENGRVGMTIPVINSDDGIVSIDLKQMTERTGFSVVNLLPRTAVSGTIATDKRLSIKRERPTIPERKRGQTVQRSVVMLERD
ncbi:MAG: DNA methyltransferase [Candidatus Thorarchaeota archaeon]